MNALILGIDGALGMNIETALKSKGWATVFCPAPEKGVTEAAHNVDLVVAGMNQPLLRDLHEVWENRRKEGHELRIVLCSPTPARTLLRFGALFGAEEVTTPDRIVNILLDPPRYHLS